MDADSLSSSFKVVSCGKRFTSRVCPCGQEAKDRHRISATARSKYMKSNLGVRGHSADRQMQDTFSLSNFEFQEWRIGQKINPVVVFNEAMQRLVRRIRETRRCAYMARSIAPPETTKAPEGPLRVFVRLGLVCLDS